MVYGEIAGTGEGRLVGNCQYPAARKAPEVTNQYPRGVAYHEAGHAVVAWALGVPVGTVHVRESDASGGTDIGATDHLTRIKELRFAMLVTLPKRCSAIQHTSRPRSTTAG